MRLKLSEIAEAAGGKLLCGDGNTAVTAFSTDSRQVKAGTMFVPIRGEKTDAHLYIDSVFENGACATFTDHEIPLREQGVVLVEDCREALQKAAAHYRAGFSIPVVGITGSVGKTSAKEMIAQALSGKFHVHKTAGNQNSQVGVPMTVCGLQKSHDAAVVEMGVSMPGEMARIAEVVKPTHAVVTNIGVSHIEYMKTRENIMAEKLHIADYLPADGLLFVNGDDDLLSTLRGKYPHRVVTFGMGPECDWRGLEFKQTEKGTFFTCESREGRTEVFVPAVGVHNVRNALASMAVARALGATTEEAVRAIAAYKAPAMRQQILEAGGLTVIDDSYNASPDSMRGALEILTSLKKPGRTFAVLADMLELGDYAAKGHFEVGEYAAERNVDFVVGIGPLSKEIVAGYGRNSSAWFSEKEEAIAFLRETLHEGDAVLVKGSRGMKTDEIVSSLLNRPDGA